MSCAKIAHESSASLLFSFPRQGRRQPYSDALLPTILSDPLRTFAAISESPFVSDAPSNFPKGPNLFELSVSHLQSNYVRLFALQPAASPPSRGGERSPRASGQASEAYW